MDKARIGHILLGTQEITKTGSKIVDVAVYVAACFTRSRSVARDGGIGSI